MGVIGIIYESRPNVTADAAGLCFKTGNAVILRGGSEAINSNKAIVDIMHHVLDGLGIDSRCIQLVEDTSRETVLSMMKLDKYIDLLIPRGGQGLINSVIKNSSIPVIQTGTGNCHVYVDEYADLAMGVGIIVNAKTSRPSVCNAAETLLVHEKAAGDFLPRAFIELNKHKVEIRGCEKTIAILKDIKPASESDWQEEFLDLTLAVKVVKSLDEAIAHIDRYGTKHSEAIVTGDAENAKIFTDRVDAAAVYVNASTRFTDGGEYGLGAEIGISTQKLHARGPMGLKEITSYKYIVTGKGHIR
jgi:glutamate-5-semialdehyde dehydrogenase